MKKLGLVVAVASALGATSAAVHAYGVGVFANGVLVPYATYNEAAGTGTVVGLSTICGGRVHWNYYDQNSKHVTDGSFSMTKNDFHAFILSDPAIGGSGTEDIDGYLTFVMDTCDSDDASCQTAKNPDGSAASKGDGELNGDDDECLAANAFQLDPANDDVAFQPVIPIELMDFGVTCMKGSMQDVSADGSCEPAGLDSFAPQEYDPLVGLWWGAWEGSDMRLRYFIDQAAGNDDTSIYIWTVCAPPSFNAETMYDKDQKPKSVSFDLPNAEVNIIDPENIRGISPGWLDGHISWTVEGDYDDTRMGYCRGRRGPGGGVVSDHRGPVDWQSAVSWSIVKSDSFGAKQTLLNPHTLDF